MFFPGVSIDVLTSTRLTKNDHKANSPQKRCGNAGYHRAASHLLARSSRDILDRGRYCTVAADHQGERNEVGVTPCRQAALAATYDRFAEDDERSSTVRKMMSRQRKLEDDRFREHVAEEVLGMDKRGCRRWPEMMTKNNNK